VTPLDETIGALDTAVRAGKARYVGISSYSPGKTAEASAIARRLGTPLVIHQPSYSLLNRWIEGGLTTELANAGMGAIAFTALGQGLLTDRYLQRPAADIERATARPTFDDDVVTEQVRERLRGLPNRRTPRPVRWRSWRWPGCFATRWPRPSSARLASPGSTSLEPLANLHFRRTNSAKSTGTHRIRYRPVARELRHIVASAIGSIVARAGQCCRDVEAGLLERGLPAASPADHALEEYAGVEGGTVLDVGTRETEADQSWLTSTDRLGEPPRPAVRRGGPDRIRPADDARRR
jgi:hypothetical protein